MNKKFLKALLLSPLLSLVVYSSVFAHVVVRPSQANPASFTSFTVGVPNERDNLATTQVRLVIPEGLKHVSPNVKPGWAIDIVTEGEGENQRVTELVWNAGEVPPHMREDFQFSAQVPVEETTLQWKAYQTYSDGSVVSWDRERDPNQKDFSENGPFSTTDVMIVGEVSTDQMDHENTQVSSPVTVSPMTLATIAIVLSLLSLALHFMKK